MDEGLRKRLSRALGMDDPAGWLSDRLSGADLNSLLLELFRHKTSDSSPADLLRRYESNRFVQPAAVDAIRLKQLELDSLTVARDHGYEPVQLSPVAPLGSCSIVAPADQNKVVSALRGTEVVADATNLLALHIAAGLKSGALDNRDTLVRCSTTHRHVRAQQFPQMPGMFAHFNILALVASGKDNGSYQFELQSFREHVGVYAALFRNGFGAEIEIAVNRRGGYTDGEGLLARLMKDAESLPFRVSVSPDADRTDNAYYKGLQFTVIAHIGESALPIGDGGFVDWTQQLLGSRKERMLISAIGLERLAMIE